MESGSKALRNSACSSSDKVGVASGKATSCTCSKEPLEPRRNTRSPSWVSKVRGSSTSIGSASRASWPRRNTRSPSCNSKGTGCCSWTGAGGVGGVGVGATEGVLLIDAARLSILSSSLSLMLRGLATLTGLNVSW